MSFVSFIFPDVCLLVAQFCGFQIHTVFHKLNDQNIEPIISLEVFLLYITYFEPRSNDTLNEEYHFFELILLLLQLIVGLIFLLSTLLENINALCVAYVIFFTNR